MTPLAPAPPGTVLDSRGAVPGPAGVPAWGRSWGMAAPVAALAYVALAPFASPPPGFGLYNGHRVMQLAVLAVGTLPLLVPCGARDRWLATFDRLPRPARIVLACVLGGGVVSAALAPFPRAAFLEVGHLALLVTLAVALASQFGRDVPLTNRLVPAVLVAGFLLYAVAFARGYATSVTYGLGVWPTGLTLNGFAHVRHFNQVQAWTLPVLVVAVAAVPARFWAARLGLVALTALGYALLFASHGRGATLALTGSAVVVGIAFGRRAGPWLRLQAAAAGLGLGLYVLLFKVLAENVSVLERLQTGADSGRLALWGTAVEMVRLNPVLGEGPMQFSRRLDVAVAHPHSSVFQWAAEWGTPSAVAVLALSVWGFVAWVRRSRTLVETGASPERVLATVAVTASIAAAAAHSLVSGVVVMPVSQTLFAVVVGWALAAYAAAGPSPSALPATPPRPARLTLVLTVMGLWTMVGVGVAPDVLHLESKQAAHVAATGDRLAPRFWRQGLIGPRGQTSSGAQSRDAVATP